MLQSFAMRTLLPLVLRAALAVVFIFHGQQKISPENGYGSKWHTNALNMMAEKAAASGKPQDTAKAPEPLPAGIQLAVGWGEFLGGVAIALGLLTRLAALGIIAIMAGAIATVHWPGGFSLATQGFEYNYVLIMVAVALILSGAGTISLDQVIRVKMRGSAKY
jgi:putative oxidoreductase